MLPKTLLGLDVNIDFLEGFFKSPDGRPRGELDLFQLANVPIHHGWLASREDEESWNVLQSVASDYDTAVNRLVEGDELAEGAVTRNTSDSNKETEKHNETIANLDMQPKKQAKVYQGKHDMPINCLRTLYQC